MSNTDIPVPADEQLAAWKNTISEVIESANNSLRANAESVALETQQQIDAAIELAAISVRGVAAEAAEGMAITAGKAVTQAMSQEVGKLLETIEASHAKTAAILQEASKNTSRSTNPHQPSRLVWFALGVGASWLILELLPNLDLGNIKEAFGLLKTIITGAFK